MKSRRKHFVAVIALLIFSSLCEAQAPKKSLAIFNFRPTNIEAMGFNSDILYTLSTSLGMESSIEIMPRRTMEEHLFRGGLSQSDNEDLVLKAGKLLRVNFVLFGQVTRQGSDIISAIKLLDIQRQRVIKDWTLTFSSREAISDRMPIFTKELVNYIHQADSQAAIYDRASKKEEVIDIESLTAVSEGSSVVISWKFDPSKPIAAFNIYRAETEEGPFQSIGRSNQNIYHDKTIRIGRTYYYQIGIIQHSMAEIRSNRTVVIQKAGEKLPYPPLIISCKGLVRRAEIKFVPSLENDKEGFNITHYEIHRAEESGGKTQVVMTVENRSRSRYDLSFTVEDTSGLLDGKNYEYSIASVDKARRTSQLSRAFLISTVSRPQLRLLQDNRLRRIDLIWDALDGVDGYIMYRKVEGGNWEMLERIRGADKTNYADTKNLTDQQEYEYYLSAFDNKGETGPSHIVKAKTKDLPPFPRDFVAKSGMVKSVWASWSPIDDPDIGGYAIYRGKTTRGLELISRIRGFTSLSYLDRGAAFSPLEDGTEYYYAITSYNLHGVEGPASEAAKAMTKPVPAAVKGLKTTITEANNILVTWEKNSEPDITSYILYRNRNDGNWSSLQTLMPNQTSYRDYDLRPDVVYRYRVIAVDKDDLKSKPTDSASVTSPVIGR